MKLQDVKTVDVDAAAEKITVTMKGSTTLDRATIDKAFKGTKADPAPAIQTFENWSHGEAARAFRPGRNDGE